MVKLLVDNFRSKSIFLIGKRICISAYVHNRILQYQTLFIRKNSTLTLAQESLTSFSVEFKEIQGISLQRSIVQLIKINGRKKKRIGVRTSNWGQNSRDWLKSATYFKSLVPT